MEMGEYDEVDVQMIGGLITIILASNRIVQYISKVEHEELNSSSIGKGCIIVRMNVKDTKLCFINAHLSPRVNKLQERI